MSTLKNQVSLACLALLIGCQATSLKIQENPISGTTQSKPDAPLNITIPPRGVIDLNPDSSTTQATVEPIQPQFLRDLNTALLIDIETGKVLDEKTGELKEPSQLTIPPRGLTIPPRSVRESQLTIPPRSIQNSLVRFAMIDAPANFKSVFVKLNKATLVDSQQNEVNIPLEGDTAQAIDLLTLRDKAIKLNDINVQPNTQYKQLCLSIKEASLIQENNQTHNFPATNDRFCIDVAFGTKSQTMDLVIIDFDALKSIQSSDTGFNFTPSLSASVLEVASADVQAIQSLAITPQFITVSLGSTIQLQALGKDAQGNSFKVQPVWSVDNPSVGSVDNKGVFTGLKEGQTVVSAKFNNQSAQVQVTVIPEPK